MTSPIKRASVIGGGAWGTALAVHAAGRGLKVRLWAREADVVDRMLERRDNPAYLPGVEIPAGVKPEHDLARSVSDAELVITVVPSSFARSVYEQISAHLGQAVPVVAATKGIEEGSLALPLEVARDELGSDHPLAVVSGPSFAREVAEGHPTGVVIASDCPELALRFQQTFASRLLRVYTNRDPIGVQLAGSLKNVMAIAAGIADGLGMGNNSLAALITRGLAEMTRLIVALGGNPRTTSGLAGLGDLVLTCTGDLSRNRQVGQRIGRGERLTDILSGSRSVAEGVRTARSARDLARRASVDMPIVEGVYRILYEDGSPQQGLDRLLSRPMTSEDDPVRDGAR